MKNLFSRKCCSCFFFFFFLTCSAVGTTTTCIKRKFYLAIDVVGKKFMYRLEKIFSV